MILNGISLPRGDTETKKHFWLSRLILKKFTLHRLAFCDYFEMLLKKADGFVHVMQDYP